MRRSVKWLIAAGVLLVLGVAISCIGLSMTGIKGLTGLNNKYETRTYDIEEDFSSINITATTDDITLQLTGEDHCRVECRIPEGVSSVVEVQEGTLVINTEDDNNDFLNFNSIGIGNAMPEITVYLPQEQYRDLSISTIMGDIILDGIVAQDSISITCVNGDVTFDECDASYINVDVTTGDIEGTLLSGKKFEATVITGDVDVPQSEGDEDCVLHSITGDITIDIV